MKLASLTLRKFDLNTKHYYPWDTDHTAYTFKEIENSEINIYIEAETLEAANKWIINNLPEYYFGSTIIMDEGRSFRMNCVPSYYYSEFERIVGREAETPKEVMDFVKIMEKA